MFCPCVTSSASLASTSAPVEYVSSDIDLENANILEDETKTCRHLLSETKQNLLLKVNFLLRYRSL